MASEIHPILQARANYLGFEAIIPNKPEQKTKVRIDFAVESINKNGSKKSRIPLELAGQIGAALSVKVDPKVYDATKHLLKEGQDLLITICPLAWKVGEGSGMFFDLIEVEKFDSILETT
jgi:hypothetical protein